ncbi:HPr family phosphocarrier protein [Cellulomonas soli]
MLTDLGSAVLTTESVLEMLDEAVSERVRLADAPFVEGAVAAAVTAFGGADLGGVLDAAQGAGSTFAGSPAPAAAPGPVAQDGVVSAETVLRNPLGLHARPAALMARMLGSYDARVTVNGVDAASVLELMKLGATQGQRLRVEATGAQGAQAVEAFVRAVEEGFGEV